MTMRFFALFAAALALGACSETKFADMMGAGKYSPDESAARSGRALSMPPDLRLAEPGTSVAAVDEPIADTGTEPVQSAALTPETAPAAPAPAAPAEDIYARHGISKTWPNGKEKTQQELYKELRAAQLAEKRKSNPNYGTIWNMGNIWTDTDG